MEKYLLLLIAVTIKANRENFTRDEVAGAQLVMDQLGPVLATECGIIFPTEG